MIVITCVPQVGAAASPPCPADHLATLVELEEPGAAMAPAEFFGVVAVVVFLHFLMLVLGKGLSIVVRGFR